MSADSKASRGVNSAGFDPKGPLDPSRALVPAVVKLNEKIVAKGLWPKLKRTVRHIPFAADVASVWFCARDPDTPTTAKALIAAALAYFVLPFDAIPDVLPIIGFTDDAAVIATVLAIVGKHLKPKHREAARAALDRLAEEA